MAVAKNIVNNETGSDITATYTWTSEAGSDHLDATDFFDVSTLTDFNREGVDRLKIKMVWISTHLSHEGTNFADNAYGVYLVDSNNVPILTFDQNSGAYYDYRCFDGYDTKDFSDDATGDLKIAMGHTYRISNGSVDPNSNVQIGCGFTITVTAEKIYK